MPVPPLPLVPLLLVQGWLLLLLLLVPLLNLQCSLWPPCRLAEQWASVSSGSQSAQGDEPGPPLEQQVSLQ